MLMNNLDPEVAEDPDDLVVYGGTGRAARSWDAFDAICATLRDLADDETLLVQSGKPVGVFRTNEWAPRVLIANSNLVPEWANWTEFRRLEALGLTMYGQMTAGSWIYIGTQGILQGTYECFAEIARRRFGGSLAGTITVTAGLGGMGGAQPLAITMNGGVALCVDVDPERDRPAHRAPLPRRGRRLARRRRRPLRRGARRTRRRCRSASSATPPTVLPALRRARLPGRHRHRPDERPRPAHLRARRPHRRGDRRAGPHRPRRARPPGPAVDGGALRGDGRLRRQGRRGVRLRQQPAHRGHARRVRAGVRLPRVPARPTSGRCSARARGRSAGSPCRAIRPTSPPPTGPCSRSSPTTSALHRWIALAGERVAFQGLPARICWLGYGERHRLGLRFNEMVRRGEVSAPIVIGRDHLDSGSVASPYRETEAMADGSDAIADWPLLNALVNTASGATWVSIHHGGGVGIGRSIHAGMVCVADGTDLAAAKLERVLTDRSGDGRDPPRRRRLRARRRGRRRARRADPDGR